MQATFWGVRGSVPSPITGKQLEAKIAHTIHYAIRTGKFTPETPLEEVATWLHEIPFEMRSTYGGNTTCLSVNCDDIQFILDMGTGIRELGLAQMSGIIKNKTLSCIALLTHVHWDHIQGFPFWAPLYLPRRVFNCSCTLYGGKTWDSQLELVLKGQMNAPVFPVNLEEIEQTSMKLNFNSIYDGWEGRFETRSNDEVRVLARKLNHPQETFGYRIEYNGNVFAFTTDNEPFAAGVPKGMIELVKNADVWVTDCQYTLQNYTGEVGGVPKHGWGHSYPEAIALIAEHAKPKRIITTHHDPQADDDTIWKIAHTVQQLTGIPTEAAYEGLVLDL